MSFSALRRLVGAFGLALLAAFSTAARRPASEAGVADVQLLAFNDFHGNLEPPSGSNGRVGATEAGGIEYLATHLARLKAANPNTVVVSAGDNIGASPLLSSMFHDEPTIEALDAVGLQVSAVGNHELDEGWRELYRMQKGGCHPVDGCQGGTRFDGAKFDYLSANIFLDPGRVDGDALPKSGRQSADGRPATLFPGSVVKEVGGVKVGFIGLTLEGAPRIVAPKGVEGLTFAPEARTANAAAADLRRRGVRAIVVLIHEGGVQQGDDPDACRSLSGAIVPIVQHMSDDIDVVISGHTHRAYNCTIGTKLVTSAESFGRLITDVDLRIDRRTGRVVSKSAHNVVVTRDVVEDAGETALLDRYRPLAAKVGNRSVGSLASIIRRAPNEAGESALGDVVADGMLEAASGPERGGAVVALMNPGGIRADLTHASSTGSDEAGVVTYADAFNVLPFGNVVIVKTLSGDALGRLLEQQFDNPRPGQNTMLQVSRGFAYAYDPSGPAGQRVDRTSITINGRNVEPAGRYRVAMPDYLWSGGDRLTVAKEGSDPTPVDRDVDLFAAYIEKNSPLGPGPRNRVRRRP